MKAIIAALLIASPLSAIDNRCPSQYTSFGSSQPASAGGVVCLVDHEVAGRYELYSVLSGITTKLSPNVVREFPFDVIRFSVSPDNIYVAYTSDTNSWTMYELYSVQIVGGVSKRLSSTMPFDNDVDDFVWWGNGDGVVYRKGRNATGAWVLYSALINSGINTILSQPGCAVAPGLQIVGGRVRYRCEQDGVYSNWVVDVDGGYPERDDVLIFTDGFEGGGVARWN